MSFVDTIERASRLLESSERLSLRALKLEFGLEDEQLEALVEELVEIRRVAISEGRALVWIGSTAARQLTAEVERPTGALESEVAAAERRQLTVLFCDLVDSTRLAAGMDAEDWRELVRGYQQAVAAVIERFEGYVAQYLGDGLLAYFGWPRAHEDDAERAVRAGLGIVEAVAGKHGESGVPFAVRVGIHTGPVVVGEMGGGERRETLALGDTTNVAARLQGFADPDTVVMSAATLRLVSGIFVTRDAGEHSLKGLAEPLRVHQAVQPSGVRSRLDVMAAAELTPFIGREQELMLLEDRFAQVAEGSGHAVLIAGEAGIGKSRLMQAFRERIAERAHTWLECQGSPYTQDSAFYPVLELHRQGLSFRPDDPNETKLDRIEAGLQAVAFDPVEMGPVVAALHGVPLGGRFTAPNLSPEGLRKKTLGLLVEWLLRLGQRQPLVLLLEDLHWMDPSTLELVGGILEQVPAASVLLLATYRPDFEPPWGARSFVTPMLLSRFTRAQLADLVRKAARGRDLPDAWVDEILRRSDGVPLFAEELTKAVLETHPEPPAGGEVPRLQIPDTLQDSLMARLDALGPVKELAQVGAVLGREFAYDLLLKVSPLKEAELRPALQVAVREELFYQRGTPPEATYLFKHALIRDAAYQSMLRATRQRHHRRVAETLIERLHAVAAAQPELVAYHWTEAGEAEHAIEWWIRSAERASARADYTGAIAHTRHGLAVLPLLPDAEPRAGAELALQVLLGLASAASLGYAHPTTHEAFERACELCDPDRDPERATLIRYYLGAWNLSSGEYRRALDLYQTCVEVGERSGNANLEAIGFHGSASVFLHQGRAREAIAAFERTASLLDPGPFWLGQVEIQHRIRSWCAWAEWLAGFADRSRESVRVALEYARADGHPFSVCTATTWAAVAALYRRDWKEARRLGAESVRMGDEQGFPLLSAIGTFAEAPAALLGDGDETAIDRYGRAIQSAGSTGNRSNASVIVGNFGQLLTEVGRLDEATELVERALSIARSIDEGFYLAELHRFKGEIARRRDSEQEADALFREAIDIARGQEAKSLELRAATSLARLWQRQGKRAEARSLLQPVYGWFTEGFDTRDLVEARALLQELGP